MPTKYYSDFIEISPTFESVVDIDADNRNTNLWREYIVGDDMEKLLEALCQSLNNEAPDTRRSFWVEGTYGTGKSYAAIFVKHLLEERPEVISDFMARNGRLAPYRSRVLKFRNKGEHLVIWKTGCTGIRDGNALLVEVEMAVRSALAEKFGARADYGEASLLDAVKRQVHSPIHNWEYILENTTLGDDYPDLKTFVRAIDSDNLTALQKTAAVIRTFNWGLVDSLDTFKKWITTVIDNNGLDKSGIFFIWDEFTEYVVNSDDRTLLQQLSEFCKKKPFFMLFVVHRTTEMVERITPERYQLIANRFHTVEFHISSDAALDLIAGSINPRIGMSEKWKEERQEIVANIRPFLPDMSGLEDRISEMIESLCPMHPMTIKLLSRVAANYAASQRTMFRFMKDTTVEDQGFAGYIRRYGPDKDGWLTADWLWDYFFTGEIDLADKGEIIAGYIRHYEDSRPLVENDENAHRVFKIVMLLLALMSSTRTVYSGARLKDGIAATEECVDLCLAGVMDKHVIHDLLETMADSRILVLDADSRGNVRLQLPFKGSNQDDFSAKLEANDKKYTRYSMFSKDGAFAQAFEKLAWDENDAAMRRMKIAVCCAETSSINTRLSEITKELGKCPYKLGLLLVSVQSDTQAISVQSILQSKAIEADEPRLTIALVKDPLTDEKRKQWLIATTKQEMASAAGQTGSAKQYEYEAASIVNTWVHSVASAGRIIAYSGTQVFSNQYGMANLRKTLRTNVQDVIFPFAPENIVVTNTAYKACNDGAPTAGIQRKSNNSQLTGVLNALKQAGILDLATIAEMAAAIGSKTSDAVAALAKLVRDEMESGRKVNLGDLWSALQKQPYGYYDTIACGVLLGYVFSCYKQSKYTWTDSAQAPHVLAEATISKMALNMCKGKMTTDYLSAGSITWQNFSAYLEKIFGLSVAQLAEQTTGYHNVREAIIKCGTPFWTLKYLPASDWNNEELQQTAPKVIDRIQVFISQEGDVEGAMNDVLQLMQGRGKIRVVLSKAFQDRNAMTATFRTFLFDVSPELKDIATKLAIRPEELSDKLHAVMQGSIYTWTEEQVKEKLADVVNEYKYLEAIGKIQGKVYHSIEAAKKDFANLFKYLRVPMAAIQQANEPWYPAMLILKEVADSDTQHMDAQKRQSAIITLEQFGAYAKDCLTDAKSVLTDILSIKGIDCTKEELDTVYAGLQELDANSSLTQFDNELKRQVGKINQARNKILLQETWRTISGSATVKEWCTAHGVPLMWIVPRDLQKAFRALIDVQQNQFTADAEVVSALIALRNMDASIVTDDSKIERAFLEVIGSDLADIWNAERNVLLTKAKIRLSNDMSAWTASDLGTLQKILKQAQQERAKREKLLGTKNHVKVMNDSVLRERVSAFLDAHPEFCDDFAK